MQWKSMSLHFKQTYEGGYRYLDRCGEFMVVAEENLGFLPTETKPTGAKLEMPDEGISVSVDTKELIIVQEFPSDGLVFLKACMAISELARDLFQPTEVVRNGFMSRWYSPYPSAEASMKASLEKSPDLVSEIGEMIEMVPSYAEWNFGYESGSFDMFVKLESIKLETTVKSYASAFGDSPRTRERVDKMNKKAERVPRNVKNALSISFDLIEEQPPPDSLKDHFDALKKHQSVLLNTL